MFWSIELEKYLNFLKNCFSAFCIVLIFAGNCYAYNNERCEQYAERYRPSVFMGAIVSLSQSVSSTGECALFFDRAKEIEHYFIANYESLKVDASRGSGEYLHGLTSLFSCNDEGAKRIYKHVQSNFSILFDLDNAGKVDGKILYGKFRQNLLNNKRDFSYCVI